jgi:peptidoglycan hydrolase CwlO-like protein
MEDRIRALEDFSQIATALSIQMDESQRRMEARQRQMEERQRQIEEHQQQIGEYLQQVEESQRVRDELIQQMLQLAAVIQAEIVRIDETHS